MDDGYPIGDQIRDEREARGLSQVQLARSSGVSRPTLRKIEGGEDGRLRELRKIASVLDRRLRVTLEPRG